MTGTDESFRTKENAKYLTQLQERVDRINKLEPSIEDLDDDKLKAKTTEFKERLRKGESLNGSLLEEAFAVVREAAWCVKVVLGPCALVVCSQTLSRHQACLGTPALRRPTHWRPDSS